MAQTKQIEFRAIVGTQRRITLPKHSGVQPGDFVVVRAVIVPISPKEDV